MIDGPKESFVGRGGFREMVSLVDGTTSPEEAVSGAARFVRERTAELVSRIYPS